MSARDPLDGSRVIELALDRATSGLDPQEQRELERLEREAGAEELALMEELERAAAQVHLAFLPEVPDVPTPALLDRLRAEARTWTKPAAAPAAEAPAPRAVRTRGWYAHPAAGWLAAAACLVLALLPRSGGAGEVAPPARRTALLSEADDALRVDWTATGDELAPAVGGDVVWSPSRQEGYMRFVGLTPNDATRLQYQLWIFDAARDRWEEHPVDGGVFDSAAGGEVIVPIVAKLPVADPRLFAITVEAPGGVVVSEKEHIVATAAVGA